MTNTRHESKNPRSHSKEFEVIQNALLSAEMFIERSAKSFQSTPLQTLESEALFLRSVLKIADTSPDLSVGECILKAKKDDPDLSLAASIQSFLCFPLETPTGALIRIHEREAAEKNASDTFFPSTEPQNQSYWSSLFSIFSDNKPESSILMREVKKQSNYGTY